MSRLQMIWRFGAAACVVAGLGGCNADSSPVASPDGVAEVAQFAVGGGGSATDVAWGPESFRRHRGKPVVETRALALPEGPEYVLRLETSAEGDQRIRDGRISLDESFSVEIGDLDPFEVVEFPLGSGALGELTVRLTGKPGTWVSVSILQESVSVSGFAVIDTWWNHSCALDTGRRAWCWGQAVDGSVGDGSGATFQTTPVEVAGGLRFSELALGFGYTCGLAVDGTAYCWGRNEDGQLGDGTTTWRFTPVAVAGGHVFEDLDAGQSHACGITSTGDAYCWGKNPNGGLGDGVNMQSVTPVLVAGGLSFESISVGNDWSCGVVAGGGAYCWGGGPFGNGSGVWTVTGTPVAAAQGSGLAFAQVEVGAAHTCGIVTGGSLYCWGSNNGGAIGDGSFVFAWTPQLVAGGHTYTSISTGYESTCAITTSGTALCWGSNDQGQVGIGTVSPWERTPQTPALPGPATSISTGNGVACATLVDGSAWCWGNNDVWQHGTGVLGDNYSPVRVTDPGS